MEDALKIQAFIFNWGDYAQRAHRIETDICDLVPTTVISSTDGISAKWVEIGKDAFFTDQWNMALEMVHPDTDLLLHIQADSGLRGRDYQALMDRIRSVYKRINFGTYAPLLDRQKVHRKQYRRKNRGDGLFEVPRTDCTFWVISSKVFRILPRYWDAKLNRFGWGIEPAYAKKAKRMKMPVVIDLKFRAFHVGGTNYNRRAAMAQKKRSAELYQSFIKTETPWSTPEPDPQPELAEDS